MIFVNVGSYLINVIFMKIIACYTKKSKVGITKDTFQYLKLLETIENNSA